MAAVKKTAGKSALIYKVKFDMDFLKPTYWTTWFAVFVLFVFMFLPAKLTDFLGNVLGDLARNINNKRRRIARKNLELCFPDIDPLERKELLKKNFRAQMRSALHYGLFWWAPKFILKKRIILKGQEYIEASQKAGRSVIIMTSHSVGLEAAVSAVTMRYPISGPFKLMKNKVINWLVAKCRTRFGTIIYTREAGLRPIIKDVRAGQVMFYLPDEDQGKERSIFVPFLACQKRLFPY